jgi:hypothetical protein
VAINVLPSDILLECLKERVANLGEKSVNLFQNAVKRSKSDLLESYIRPNLLSPGNSYIYIAEDKGGKGSRRAFDPGNTVAASKATLGSNLAFPGRWGLFTNPLAWIDIEAPGPRPSDRAINIGFTCYTLEFDKIPLSQQLKMIWSGGLRRTDEILQCFRDYRGFEVVYGGRKSLHFHFVFDLRHWNHDLAFANNSSYQDHWLADFPDNYLREAHEDRWYIVQRAFCRGTGIEAEADPSLQYWEQNRRVPLALRLVEEGHPLGLPVGSYVRQYVLASSVRRHIPRRGKAWFHHSHMVGSSAIRHVQRQAKQKFVSQGQTRHEVSKDSGIDEQRFHKFLVENFPKLTIGSDLRYARVEFGPQGPKLHLYNDANDQTPSSVIQGDYHSVLLQGHHSLDGKTFRLGISPNKLFGVMVERDTGFVDAADHLLSRIFEAEVHDCTRYRGFLREHIVTAMEAARLVLILGPEGCGKSSAVMRSIDRLVSETGEPVFISSPSYAQSAEKIHDFTAMYPNGPFIAFEYLSLTELYQRHCPEGTGISETDALEMGYSSWLRAVHDQQPEIYAMMRAHRDELHAIRDRGQIPVLFGVHETVRRHTDTGMTRVFYAESFDERWFQQMTPEDRQKYRTKLRFETTFARVVLDEVSPGDLVSIHRIADVQWAWAYQKFVEKIPESDKLARYNAFKKYRVPHPRPRDDDNWADREADWSYVNEILHANYSDDDLVQINTDRVPFDDMDGIYMDCIGRPYYVAPRMWWREFSRTTLLTTELIPAQIITALSRRATPDRHEGPVDRCPVDDDRSEEPYRVFHFDQPGLFADFVHIETHRDCKKQTLPRLIAAYDGEFPAAVVISDMAKDRVDGVRVITHLSARGSNELDKRHLVAFYTAPSTELFAQLAALDAKLGTRNSIALWYVDRFNQTAGRNRGFRGQFRKTHIAVMGYRMYEWLAPYLFTWSRYAFPRRRCSVEIAHDV